MQLLLCYYSQNQIVKIQAAVQGDALCCEVQFRRAFRKLACRVARQPHATEEEASPEGKKPKALQGIGGSGQSEDWHGARGGEGEAGRGPNPRPEEGDLLGALTQLARGVPGEGRVLLGVRTQRRCRSQRSARNC